jgi:ubiquinone/menaquinone biosynthesis C-methylase UbiE
VAFEPLAAVYDALTAHGAWLRDGRALGDLVGGPRVLDLGVGPGTAAVAMARAAPGRRHVGLDLSATMVARAARRARAGGVPLALVRGDALRLPFRDGAFDGATGHSVLYLLPDAGAALAELRRVVRPGGRVAFLEPSARPGSFVRALAGGGPRHALAMAAWRTFSSVHARFTPPALAAALEAAGFAGACAWRALAGHGVVVTAMRP